MLLNVDDERKPGFLTPSGAGGSNKHSNFFLRRLFFLFYFFFFLNPAAALDLRVQLVASVICFIFPSFLSNMKAQMWMMKQYITEVIYILTSLPKSQPPPPAVVPPSLLFPSL